MESLSLTAESVSADVSEFARAELAAFAALSKRQRPYAWWLVKRVQRACRRESPATAAGLSPSERVLAGQSPASSHPAAAPAERSLARNFSSKT